MIIEKLSPAAKIVLESRTTELVRKWQFRPLYGSATNEQRSEWFLNDFLDRISAADCALGVWTISDCVVAARRVKWDSNHFGFDIAELDVLNATNEVTENAVSETTDVVRNALESLRSEQYHDFTVKVDSGDTQTQRSLQKLGFLLSDTIVTYRLENIPVTQATQHSVRAALESDITPLGEIAAECFGNRKFNLNRFNSDLRFEENKVRELYSSWLGNSVNRNVADEVLVCEMGGRPVGFITLQLPKEIDKSRGINTGYIPLNAVHPEFQNQGIYNTLVDAALHWFTQRGVTSVEIGTQLPNNGVHKVWSRRQARIVWSGHRFHLHDDD